MLFASVQSEAAEQCYKEIGEVNATVCLQSSLVTIESKEMGGTAVSYSRSFHEAGFN